MHYLEKQINGGDWFAMLQSENRSELIDQIAILRENHLAVHDYTENTFYIPELNTKYRIIDKKQTDHIFTQLANSI